MDNGLLPDLSRRRTLSQGNATTGPPKKAPFIGAYVQAVFETKSFLLDSFARSSLRAVSAQFFARGSAVLCARGPSRRLLW
jgi:hypothetical protein